MTPCEQACREIAFNISVLAMHPARMHTFNSLKWELEAMGDIVKEALEKTEGGTK